MLEEPVVYYKPGCPFGIRLRAALTCIACRSAQSASGTTRRERRRFGR